MQVVQWLFLTPMGQLILTWTLIILGILVAALVFMYFWTMLRGGIPTWALYVKGGARFGRIYKAKETDTAIEVGQARFLKPSAKLKDEKDNVMTDEHGQDVVVQLNPPLTFWRRLRAAKLFLVAEGIAQVLSWKQLVEGLPQTPLSPEQLKNDPQVKAVVAAVEAFGGAPISKWVIFILVMMAFVIGVFVSLTMAATGIIPLFIQRNILLTIVKVIIW